MALLSDLVRIVAAVEGLEEVSVGIFARQAREAGLISQGGRGRSAAKMSIRDAANLLIAVNGCHLAKEVAARVPQIRELSADKRSTQTVLGIAAAGDLFGDNLERLIRCFERKDGERQYADPPGATYIRFFRPTVMVDVEMRPSVGNSYQQEKVTYGRDKLGDGFDGPDRWDETVISHITLRAIAEAL